MSDKLAAFDARFPHSAQRARLAAASHCPPAGPTRGEK